MLNEPRSTIVEETYELIRTLEGDGAESYIKKHYPISEASVVRNLKLKIPSSTNIREALQSKEALPTVSKPLVDSIPTREPRLLGSPIRAI